MLAMQEKAPYAVAEKGEARVVHDPCNSRPLNAPQTQIHWSHDLSGCTVVWIFSTTQFFISHRLDTGHRSITIFSGVYCKASYIQHHFVLSINVTAQSSLADMSKLTHCLIKSNLPIINMLRFHISYSKSATVEESIITNQINHVWNTNSTFFISLVCSNGNYVYNYNFTKLCK